MKGLKIWKLPCCFLFAFALIVLIAVITFKIIKNKELPSNSYTPFDYITGQSNVEFHEEKEEKEEDMAKDDNKGKT
ncbi:hypothetical protein BXP28_06030 [Paenibacillus larvae subsp. larvae]|nr:DUF3951 domain-containing protein [Paenibacillus larvae]AQR76986.1 hypothetical protein BXP28_06030 [Paenibacillus larvae subsp. larvae]